MRQGDHGLLKINCILYTVYVQIFGGCIFHECLFPDNFCDFNLRSPEISRMAPFLWKISTPRVAQALMYAFVCSTGALRIISDHLRMSSFHLSSCVHGYNVSKDV